MEHEQTHYCKKETDAEDNESAADYIEEDVHGAGFRSGCGGVVAPQCGGVGWGVVALVWWVVG